MQITMSNTTLTVNNCYPYRYPSGKLVLIIEIPKSEISFDDLAGLFDGYTGDIIKIDDGTETILHGFTYNMELTYKDSVYHVEAECRSESEYQIGILQDRIVEQNAMISQLNQVISAQTNTISGLMQTIEFTQDALDTLLFPSESMQETGTGEPVPEEVGSPEEEEPVPVEDVNSVPGVNEPEPPVMDDEPEGE